MTNANTSTPGASNVPAQNANTPAPGNQPAAKPAAPAAGAEQPGSPAAQPGAAPANSDNLYRPAGMPDHLVGASNNETIDNLYKAVDGFRKAQAEKGVPESAAGYTIDLPDEVKSAIFNFGEDGKDPVWEAITPVFHEEGISQKGALAIVSKLAEILPTVAQAAGANDSAADFEYASYGGADKAKPHIDGVTAWASALHRDGKLSEKALNEIKLSLEYGEGLSMISELRVAMGAQPIPANISQQEAESTLTEEQLQTMVKDPRYWKTKEPDFIRQVDEGFQKVYGGK